MLKINLIYHLNCIVLKLRFDAYNNYQTAYVKSSSREFDCREKT